jgi:hypothetical protein
MAECGLPFNVETLSSDPGALFACGKGISIEKKRKDPKNERITNKK